MTADRTAEQLALEAAMKAALDAANAAEGSSALTLVVAGDVWEALTGDLPPRFNKLPARFAGYDLRRDIENYGPDLEPGAWRVVDEYGRQLARSAPSAETVLRAVEKALRDQQSRHMPSAPAYRAIAACHVDLLRIADDFGVTL